MTEKKDSELVALVRDGDKDSFNVLAGRYREAALRFALRMVSREDIAQDMIQEALLRAFLSLDSLREPARFKSWFYGIVLNICRSYLRNRKVETISLDTVSDGLRFDAIPIFNTVITPEKIVEERELHKTVIDAIETLSPNDREATHLFYYDQLSLREISILLGISVGAVKVRLHRARERLKEELLVHHPEIAPRSKRRKHMIKVTVVDVIKQEVKIEYPFSNYVIVLLDESGKRTLPIWVGREGGESIAMALQDFTAWRPQTHSFYAGLLKSVNVRVQEVRIETLRERVFYAVVKVKCGNSSGEVDARPSDGIALAILTGCPIFATEEVLEIGGVDAPDNSGKSITQSGVDGIIGEIEEIQRLSMDKLKNLSLEDVARAKESLINSVFNN